MASPLRIANPKHYQDIIPLVLEGTKRVQHAAKMATVKRVILRSYIVSIMCSIHCGCFGSEDWTALIYPKLNTYVKSKVLFEKAA